MIFHACRFALPLPFSSNTVLIRRGSNSPKKTSSSGSASSFISMSYEMKYDAELNDTDISETADFCGNSTTMLDYAVCWRL